MTASLGELADRTPATRDRYVDFLRAVSILCGDRALDDRDAPLGPRFHPLDERDRPHVVALAGDLVPPGDADLLLRRWVLEPRRVRCLSGAGREHRGVHPEPARAIAAPVAGLPRRVDRRAGRRCTWPTSARRRDRRCGETRDSCAGCSRRGRPSRSDRSGSCSSTPWSSVSHRGRSALHRRFGLWVPAAMVIGTIVADWVGFMGGHPIARWANVAFVLLFPHQLGHAYGDGSMPRWPRAAFWAMVVAGLAGLILLTNPRSGSSSATSASRGSPASVRTRRACSAPTSRPCRTPTRRRSASCSGACRRSAR